ncbi:MAG: hypothetical protein ABH830_00345 [Patescibacteria group bacterium]
MQENNNFEEENSDLEENPTHFPLENNYPIRTKFSNSQKIAAASLAVFAVLVISLWMIQLKNSISQPLAYKSQEEAGVSTGNSTSEEANLMNKDTDKDGLSDWDELYVYNTSPYLEDSDSDGFSDKNEIDSENDPNCPTGRDCFSSPLTSGEAEAGSPDYADDLNSLLNQTGTALTPNENPAIGEEQALTDIISGQSDAATLRQMLFEAGMDQEILDKISDEVLMETYAEVLGGGE